VTKPAVVVIPKEDEEFSPHQIDDIIQQGDLSSLEPMKRSKFLAKLAEHLKLNPFSRPFDLIQVRKQDGSKKLIVYANKSAGDQIRERDNISVIPVDEGPLMLGDEPKPEIYCVRVTIQGLDKESKLRSEPAIGTVSIAGLSGEDLANAIMKCHTKAARRGTLAFAGLGFPDETEVSSIQGVMPQGGEGQPAVYTPKPPKAVAASAEVTAPLPRAKADSKPPVVVRP
jgi:hypothetical protein